jgi:Fe-S cluster assembly ATP-binding protein
MKNLRINDLHVAVGDKEILKGITLEINRGEIHAIMGPNGSGKSVFSNTIMGDPRYKITRGDILLDGESILPLKVDERARRGIFLAFQYPQEVPGVSLSTLLWTSINARNTSRMDAAEFQKRLKKEMKRLKMDEGLTQRSVNEGFSGGEKKKSETLQLSLLSPEVVILDEPDSGLDVDAMKIVATAVKNYTITHPDSCLIVITHYQRILRYIKPRFVHVLVGGRIVKSGGYHLAREVESKGYEQFAGGGNACA